MTTRLEQLRKQRNVSQEEVAKFLGITRQTYAKIEKWEKDLTLWQAVKLADFFDVTVEDILNIKEDVNMILSEKDKLEKYKELILLFLQKASDDLALPKTKLAKLCYLADFAWFYEHLQPMIWLKYRKNHYWPVPDTFFKVLNDMMEEGSIELEEKGDTKLIRSTWKIIPKYFSKEELQLIDKIAKKWKDFNTKEIVDFTHNQLPYKLVPEGEFIPYSLITQEDPDNVW